MHVLPQWMMAVEIPHPQHLVYVCRSYCFYISFEKVADGGEHVLILASVVDVEDGDFTLVT